MGDVKCASVPEQARNDRCWSPDTPPAAESGSRGIRRTAVPGALPNRRVRACRSRGATVLGICASMPSAVQCREQSVELRLFRLSVHAVQGRRARPCKLGCHGHIRHDHAFFQRGRCASLRETRSIAVTCSAESMRKRASGASKSSAPRRARALCSTLYMSTSMRSRSTSGPSLLHASGWPSKQGSKGQRVGQPRSERITAG